MEVFRFIAPVHIEFGPGTVARLGEHVRGLGSRALLITDPGLVAAGIAEQVQSVLKEAGVDMTSPEPVEQALALFARLLDQMEELAR